MVDLGELQMPFRKSDVINVSRETLGQELSNQVFQSEMTLDVNPTNPLHLTGFSYEFFRSESDFGRCLTFVASFR
jgi:hypothetical protein